MKDNSERFVQFTLSRRITVLMLFSAIILIGVIAVRRMPLELLPTGFVSGDVSISIPFPNATPSEVEEQVTRPTEEVLRQIAGLENIKTSSSKDSSSITVSLGRAVDPDEAFAEIREKLEIAKLSWPEEVQEYRTFRFNLDTDMPIYSFGAMLPEWENDTSFLVDEKIVRELEAVDGVARVQVWGVVEDTIRVFIDRERARANNVSIYDISQALSGDSIDVSGGQIREGDQTFFVRSEGRFRDIQEMRNFPIRKDLRLEDVAEVTSRMAYRNWVFRLNGQRSIWVQINKEAGANTVDVCRRIDQLLDDTITKDPRLLENGWTWFRRDQQSAGNIVTGALEQLLNSALIGGLLALIPLLFFLRRLRLTVIIILAIPASLLITLGWQFFSTGSLNLFSMLGITIAIGMLVDNSIVVVENIFRYRRKGAAPVEAAVKGTSEVALAVAVATLTTVAAFLPLIFMNSQANVTWIARGIGLPVCFSVLASLIVALLFIPLATVTFYSSPESSRSQALLPRIGQKLGVVSADGSASRRLILFPIAVLMFPFRVLDGIMNWLLRTHEKLLGLSLRNRFAAGVVFLLGMQLMSLPFQDMEEANFVEGGGGNLSIEVKLENNFTLLHANEVFQEVAHHLEEESEAIDLDFHYYFFDRSGGSIILGLKDTDGDSVKEAVKHLNDRMPKIPGVKLKLSVEKKQQDADTIRFALHGPDARTLNELSHEIADRLEQLPDVQAVQSSATAVNDEIVIRPDRERMQMLGVNTQVLMGTLSFGLRARRLPDFHSDDQRVQTFIEYAGAQDANTSDLNNFAIWSDSGTTLPLGNLVEITQQPGYGTIRKEDGRASVDLTIKTLSNDKKSVRAQVADALSKIDLPDGYSYRNSDDEKQQMDLTEVMSAFFLACILVALLMGILFEHILLPLAVLVSIPFAWVGAFFTLWLTNTPRDMVSMIGLIVLVGIVVNNGIVLLDCAHRLVRDGMDRRQALMEAGRLRLRPILMTAGTTIIGLLPMAMADDSGSFISYRGLARGVAGGLFFSTVCTLVAVPVVYSLIDDAWLLVRRHFSGALRRRSLDPQ